MGWSNLHGYFPVPPFLFTTGNPCWIPVVDWHSAIKRVTSLNSSEIKGDEFGEVVTLIQEEAFSMITINRNQKKSYPIR